MARFAVAVALLLGVGCRSGSAADPSGAASAVPIVPTGTPSRVDATASPALAPALVVASPAPQPPFASADDPEEPPPPPADGEIEGTIATRRPGSITVATERPIALAPGRRAQVLRHFERRLGSATLRGWIDVARAEVLAVDGSRVTLRVVEETARVTINGRKQDQLQPGYRVRLEPS